MRIYLQGVFFTGPPLKSKCETGPPPNTTEYKKK